MPKKRKKTPPSRARRTGAVPPYEQRPSMITLGGPRVPSRGWGFQALIDAALEAGQPFLNFMGQAPDGYSSDFCAQVDSPRAPLQAGWYLRSDLAVPIYIWVFSESRLFGDKGGLDLRRRGFASYVAHSVCTHGRADTGYASAEIMETWTPIVAPDPSIVDTNRYGGYAPGYSTPPVKQLPPGGPRKVGVLDVDYARVAGQRLPERWDIDVVGLLVVERQEAAGIPGREIWRQVAFYAFRDRNLSGLNAAADEVDLIIGHNLFDGDYRCLRTYADRVDVGRLVAKTVDTLYAARHVVTGGLPRAANLGLTDLAHAQGLRDRAKKESRTEAHRGIKTFYDAEEDWFFQPVSDDCELMLELWLELVTSQRLRRVQKARESVEHLLGEEELRLLLKPQLTPAAFANLLMSRGTVYRQEGMARNETVARIHREIEQQRADGISVNRRLVATHRQRCMAPGDLRERQCDQLIPAAEMYCRDHRTKRRCRGNPTLDDKCMAVVRGDLAHCDWHRRTALYVLPGQRVIGDFSLALPLPGWDKGSDWGYDTGTRSFFARLYRNGDNISDSPTVWLVGVDPDLTDVVALTDAVQAATGQSRRDVVASLTVLTADQEMLRERAMATQDWEPAECEGPCPCGTSDCGHGEPCPNDECSGHDIHVMRNPRTDVDVTAWQDHFDCCEGCGASAFDIALPNRPWGEVCEDGTVTVYAGVSHYEFGACCR
ncbi:hypothetical protein [Streptomyces murinus]|uniref:hypothetical protein n=2 Tax=Streptomyces murinus TaxID=33900 RepID=UPI0021B03173|nr:hypothetical protein [Streptomyces murinus]UWW91114.1 hypothetical protein GO605_09765 [Streptomyces murinus]